MLSSEQLNNYLKGNRTVRHHSVMVHRSSLSDKQNKYLGILVDTEKHNWSMKEKPSLGASKKKSQAFFLH
ncbi:hypothetical protein TYRP_010617 [Tyrophagus putrescentiae]|nr:hypothetical protein TYRP_010617 [Tyrophagus putrescentiae]